MKRLLPVAALLLSSTAASAQLVPQDILDNWRGFYAVFGATISSSPPEITGNNTRYNNVLTLMNTSDTEARYGFDWVEITSNPDGSLDITFSPEGYATSFIETAGTVFESRASYDFSGLTIHAQGRPDDIRYTYSATLITLFQNQSLPDSEISTTIALENLQSDIRSVTLDDLISETSTSSVGSLSAKFTFQPRAGGATFLDYRAENLRYSYDTSLPRLPVPEAPLAVQGLAEDFVFGFVLETGPTTTMLDQKTGRSTGRFTFTQSGGNLSVAYAENALSYNFTANEATLNLANIPAQPVDFSALFSRFNLGFTLPVRPSDTPSPFALSLALKDLTIDDNIWRRIDPENTLARTPASLAFSLNGTVKLLADLFDNTALSALPGAAFELRSLSLNALSLNLEGMGLSGEGDLTFNNGRLDPMSGFPEPKGTLEFSVNGALGMLDKIGRLGLFEPMVIIGAKGALGMFATPNSGPDSFSSRIEFSEGGGISVNGQQVK